MARFPVGPIGSADGVATFGAGLHDGTPTTITRCRSLTAPHKRPGKRADDQPRAAKMNFVPGRLSKLLMVAFLLALIWLLFDIILLILAAVLIAVALRLGAEPFQRYLKVPSPVALTLSGLLILVVVAGTFYLFGTRITAEMADVVHRVETAAGHISSELQGSSIGRTFLAKVHGASIPLASTLENILNLSIRSIEAVIFTVIAGIYLAAQPTLYRDGLLKLFPHRYRSQIGEAVDDVLRALRLWLLGQLIQMALIGLLSCVAAWAIGLTSPFVLGLIAAVAEFIPYLGPLLAAIPAILVAMTLSVDAMIWTVVAYLLIHQIEGNLIVPLVQRRMVFIAPAVILLAIMAITFLFGGLTVVMAAPVTVVISVLISKLYVHDTLGDEVSIPGDVHKTA